MIYAKQSTAVTLLIGPFLDDADGNTPETALTIAQADVRLSKNGGNMAQKNESTSCTHDELGYYTCPLDTTDTGTLGLLKLMVHESGALPVWEEIQVVTANVYDTLFSTDQLDVNVTNVGGTAQTANDNGADINAILVDTAVIGALGAGLTAVPWNSAWDAEVQSEVTDALNAYDPPTRGELTTDTNSIITQVNANETKIDAIDGIVDAILVDTGTTLPAEHGALATEAKQDIIDTNIDQIETAVITNAAGTDIAADIIALKSVADGIPTTAMRGTDSAALASVCTETRLAELDGANLPADIADIPTVAEFEARSLVSADYVVVDDTIAAVTAVGSVTGAVGSVTAAVVTDAASRTASKATGFATEAKQDIIDGIVDAILAMLDDARPEPGQGAPPVNSDLATKIDYLYKALRNKKTSTATAFNLYNDAGDTIDQKSTNSDNGTTATVGELGTGA